MLLGLGMIATGSWGLLHGHAPREVPRAAAEPAPLPLPPMPPRVAQGEDYEHCLAMLQSDPAGARAFADAWDATGGGEGAQHCLGLAQIALGAPAKGATILETLAGSSHAPDLARAAVYGQSAQAWLMAGEAARAYATVTLALTLAPEDADLLIDRSIAAATLERYKDAIDDLDQALSLDPKRGDALVFRAAAYRHLDEISRAEDDVDHALLLNPEDADALLERGILRERVGNPAGARTDWERAIALAPDTATSDLAQQNLALLEAGPAQQ